MQTDDSATPDPAGQGSPQSASDTPADSTPSRSGQSRRAALIRTIEGEMVPRLLMLCRTTGAGQANAASPGRTTDSWDVEELARLLVAHNPEIARAFVEGVRERGVPDDRICTGLLAPAARLLARQCEQRGFSKSELALGLHTIRTVLLDIGNATKPDSQASVDT